MAPPAESSGTRATPLKVEDAREAGATLASGAAFVGSHDGS